MREDKGADSFQDERGQRQVRQALQKAVSI